MIRPGMVSVTFRALSPEQIVELVRAAGLQGIEWGGDVHVPPGDAALARRVAGITHEAGLAVASYGSYFRVGEQDVSEFEPVIETARILGAPNIRVWAGRRGSAEADAAYHRRVREDSRRLAERAAAAGLQVSYEYHRNTVADTLEATQALLAAVDHPRLFTYWQPERHLSVEENAAVLQGLMPRLSNVHVFHWNERERLRLADGEAAWQAYFALLRQDGKERWALMEFVRDDDPQVFVEDAAVVKRLCGA